MMCGIVGYVGFGSAPELLIEALKRLEYRGYDSSGIAVLTNNPDSASSVPSANGVLSGSGPALTVHKQAGHIAMMEQTLPPLMANIGMAHTRWATHGAPNHLNAHPHTDEAGDVAVVHNGIIDNYLALKEQLRAQGVTCRSDTDSEVLAHLIAHHFRKTPDLLKAVQATMGELTGSYALVVLHRGEPDCLVVAANESPLVVGVGDRENFVASDVPALLAHTDRVIYLQDGWSGRLTSRGIELFDRDAKALEAPVQRITWTLEDSEKGGYAHFMLKEIFEQPQALHDSLRDRLSEPLLEGININGELEAITIVACGTSYHAGLLGRYMLEQLTSLPVTVQMASEYKYGHPTIGKPLVVLISQSGETADTREAAKVAQRRGCKTLAICNVVGSSLTRICDATMLTHAGPEIGVAATKTFLTQVLACYLLAIHIATVKDTLTPSRARELERDLRSLPRMVQTVLDNHEKIRAVASGLVDRDHLFFIGRGLNYPTALEGALKMKEISYIHAEGYPAGELKHGPLALLGPEAPTIALAMPDHTYAKLLSNIGEVSARGSPVIAIAVRGDREVAKLADQVLYIPPCDPMLTPFPATVVLQLLSYYVADARGCEIDKPRNLAKSVTVE